MTKKSDLWNPAFEANMSTTSLHLSSNNQLSKNALNTMSNESFNNEINKNQIALYNDLLSKNQFNIFTAKDHEVSSSDIQNNFLVNVCLLNCKFFNFYLALFKLLINFFLF